MNKSLPWWAQLGLAVVAVIGTVATEYFRTERLLDANSSKANDDDKVADPKRKRAKSHRASK